MILPSSVTWGATLALLSTAALGKDVDDRNYCLKACTLSLANQPFQELQENLNVSKRADLDICNNQLYLSSVLLCLQTYCNELDAKRGLRTLQDDCSSSGNLEKSKTNITLPSGESSNSHILIEYDQEPSEIKDIAIPSKDYFSVAFHTVSTFWDIRHVHLYYSYAMFAFWACIMLLSFCVKSLQNLQAWQKSSELGAPKPIMKKYDSHIHTIWTKLRAHVFLPPTFTYHCHVPIGQCTIPPRIESLVLAVFLVVNIALCSMSYPLLERNIYYRRETMQFVRYFSDRTGYLSYANLAISWLFGIRNNFLIQLTGLNFATFNRFHRWTARISTLEAVLHSLGYTVFALMRGGISHYLSNFTKEYWYSGVIATVAMSILLGVSILWLRVNHYDTFLILHIILAVVVLVTLFFHTRIFDGEYDWFLWLCVGFWIFDRAARAYRVLYGFFHAKTVNALVEYAPDEDLIRIDVTDIVAGRKLPSECYFYLYQVDSIFPWQSHPFSIVSWTELNGGLPAEETNLPNNRRLSTDSDRAALLSPSERALSQQNPTTKFSFLVRPYNGFTKRLRQSALLSTGTDIPKPEKKKFLLEGPYEGGEKLEGCSELVLILGGSGIAAGISYIYKALQSPNCPSITLVWAVRKFELMDSVIHRELNAAIAKETISIDGYVTRQREVRSDQVTDKYRKLCFHRPSVGTIVHEAAQNAIGELGVVVCGPAQMTDDARAAVVKELKAGQSHVHLFVESFNW